MARVTLKTAWYAPGGRYYHATESYQEDGKWVHTWVEVPDAIATPQYLPPGAINLDWVEPAPAPSAELIADQKLEAEVVAATQADALVSRRRKVAPVEG